MSVKHGVPQGPRAKKRVIEYLFFYLLDATDEAWREPKVGPDSVR